MNDYKILAEEYDRLGDKNKIYRLGRTDYLVTRELPEILSQYNTKKILDFGCGAGLSTRFVKELGYECTGVDINEEMLFFAKQKDNDGTYIHITSQNKLPFKDETFDLVVSIFVLFEIPSINQLIVNFKEISRVLKKNSMFIAITGSEELYRRNWLSLDANFPENKNPNSGSVCRIKLIHANLILNDYYWKDSDYAYIATTSGFKIHKKQFPLGKNTDGITWKDEINYAPYVFYEFKKIR